MNQLEHNSERQENQVNLAQAKPERTIQNRVDQCRFCASTSCYTRIVTAFFEFDEVACHDHIRDLELYADRVLEGGVRHCITSSDTLKRGKIPTPAQARRGANRFTAQDVFTDETPKYDPTEHNWSCQWQDGEYGVNGFTLEGAIAEGFNYIAGDVEPEDDPLFEPSEEARRQSVREVEAYIDRVRQQCITTGRARGEGNQWGVYWEGAE